MITIVHPEKTKGKLAALLMQYPSEQSIGTKNNIKIRKL